MAGTGKTSVRSYNFFLDTTIQAPGTYAANEHEFLDTASSMNFVSQALLFANDSANPVYFSFDGTNDHGRIKAGETLQMDFRKERKIWFRGTAGDAIRFWAW